MLNPLRMLRRRRTSEYLDYAPTALQLVITDALHERDVGQVVCLPPDSMVPPFQIQWFINDEYVDDTTRICTDASGLCAKSVPPSTVRVVVIDSQDNEAETHGVVRTMQLPIVVGYECDDASDALARDGQVRAIISNAPPQCRYLWTSGVVTREPVLRYVPAGEYAVTLLHSSHSAPLPFVHCTDAARVVLVHTGSS